MQAVLDYLIQHANGQKVAISVADSNSLIMLTIREEKGNHLAGFVEGADFSTIKLWAEELTGTLELTFSGPEMAVLNAQMPNTLIIDDKK